MDDRATVKQLASARLQKAINKNQTFDSELQKELRVLEIKKKVSQKAFEQKRTQFLKNRVCLEPLKKSQSFHCRNGPENWRQERTKVPGLLDLRNYYSTGNLLESLLNSRKKPSCVNEGSREKNGKLFKKFRLDSAKHDGDKKKCLNNWGKLSDEPHSWNDKHFQGKEESNETDKRGHINATSTENLRAPPSRKKLSFSNGNLSDKTSRQEKWVFKRQEEFKGCGASTKLTTIPPIAKVLSAKSDESLSRKDEKVTNQRKNLSLPPLGRTRSKSLEASQVLPENETKITGDKGVEDTRKLSWNDVANIQQAKKNAWVSGSVEQRPLKKQDLGHGGEKEVDMNLKPDKIERSTSTPDLLDIEPEVEYLLLKDDKIRLRRLRASVHAIQLMGDMKDCRYIRKVDFSHQEKQETNPQTDKVSGNDYPDHVQIDRTEFEGFVKRKSQSAQDISSTTDIDKGLVASLEANNLEGEGAEASEAIMPTSEEDVFDATKSEGEASADERDHLNSSTGSGLAEMFDEIKHTRYLRIRPRMSSGDPDDYDNNNDDDYSCKMSYGYRVPMIIVGHTKAVLTPEES